MSTKKKKERKKKNESKSLSFKLAEERKEKIIRLIRKGELKKANSLLDTLRKNMADKPEVLAESLVYIAGKISNDKIQTLLLNEVMGNCTNFSLKKGNYKITMKICRQILKIKPDDLSTLCIYGMALGISGLHEEAIKKFKQILEIKPNYYALINYGVSLGMLGRNKEAIEKFEQSLKIKPDDLDALVSYGVSLANLKQYEEAIEKFEQVLKIEPNNLSALNNYGIVMGESGRFEEAIEKFKQVLKIEPNNIKNLINYGITLTLDGRYIEAIEKFEQILNISSGNDTFVYLNLGILHYKLKLEPQADKYFKLAIEHSDDKDAARIKIAQNIFAVNPYSQEGIDILKEVTDSSPQYPEAFETLTLNLSPKEYWEMFSKHPNANSLKDTEMLNRSIYHKIKNEISILKGIAHRITYQSQTQDEILSEIIDGIEYIIEQINQCREQGKAEAKRIPDHEYEKLIHIISETAHDISDFVINEMATIESKIRRIMWKMAKDDALYPLFEKLLEQIEFTQNALNDLKSVNQGINIRYNHFQIRKLFEKWEKTQKIENATIFLNIQNPEFEFNGDEEKIKSALNELIENSIKHNPEKKDLEIKIVAKIDNTSDVMIPLRQPGLFIEYSDNGKGIPSDKKDQIFLPLETTSEEGEGSGLGLFIIKRTVSEMKGYIHETGENGARFEIYIPYVKDEENEHAEGNRKYSSAVG